MQPIKNILLVLSVDRDDSPAMARAVAAAKSNQASLTIAAVVTPPAGYSLLSHKATFNHLLKLEVSRSRQVLEAACAALRADTSLDITTDVLIGKADLEIIKEVLRTDCGLVIKSSEEIGGLRSALFGSSDMNLMRKCPCPVLILKPTGNEHFRVIVAAVDQEDDAPENHLLNLKILEFATWFALAESSELHIVHAWTMSFESLLRSHRSSLSREEVDSMSEKEEQARLQWLDELLKEFARDNESAVNYLSPKLHTIKGHASRGITEKTRELDADLIVMGTVGRVGIPGFFMGNTSETILQHVDCSGLTVKPPGFACPISP